MRALAILALIVLLAEAGRALGVPLGLAGDRWRAFGVHLAAGLVATHLLLLGTSLAGFRWAWLAPLLPAALLLLALSPAGSAAAAALATDRVPATSPAPRAGPDRLGWGDLLAAAGLATFTALAVGRWIVMSDFIYHWSTKAEHFALAQGVDYARLAPSWNWRLHPDYPTLYPELMAVAARLEWRFDAGAQMVWSAAFLAALLASARAALAAAADRFVRQSGIALLGLGLAAFGIGNQMGGAADWLVAWAVMLALPPLLAPRRGAADDWQLGLAAALAASSKLEGVPLAAFLLGAHLLRRDGRRPRLLAAGAAVRSAVLPLFCVVPWLLTCLRLNLFLGANPGHFELARWAQVWPAALKVMVMGAWLGAPLLLAALPVLAFRSGLRPFAIVCLLQLAFYLYPYLATAGNTQFYVVSSLPRLLLHLLPAIAVVLLLMTDGAAGGRARPEAS